MVNVRRIAVCVAALILSGIPPDGGASATGLRHAQKTAEKSEICRHAIGRTEHAFRLPVGILQAIALAESGRWDGRTREKFAWPWTVTAHGRGTFYPDRAAAIAAVRTLKRDGVKNIDVGCMQINLMHHPDAFASLDEAFDPIANSRYAARLFTRLRKANRSLTRAIAHYHSTTRKLNIPYTRKVVRLWNEERRRHFSAERRRKIDAWHAERERRRRERMSVR